MKKMMIMSALALFSSSLFAANLTLQKEITPQIVNGEGVTLQEVHNGNRIELKPGHNQIAVTIGQIVFEDGKRRKFDSQPLLLEFVAKPEQALTLEYGKFRTIDDAKKFENNPTVHLTDAQGNPVAFTMVQLYKGGLQGFRDYEREVADYNAQKAQKADSVPLVNHDPKAMDLKTAFKEMTRQEQQAFMQWAMQNLK
ncbi:DUF2057 domain-containing protein [Vibrio vulnificus]|uniref:YccT family protein n=1 Tax=Vibrio vulnificus TaxID=672 RepID=UPI001A27A226|nr:DUF2057 domain-containing protein [Vibrio vulnificus]EGQ7757828.1 DUF2057 domain-containing protein [Vibrio vulnificus]EGQ9992537.1 DUF2057 domain-containing protein [Vibrio vulnificus]EHU9472416.1 DUF2057 domain-containing protein [Vibrio vulnificus]EMA2413618.1 DUF2057 domain-containing protein [Vibrio vulnificus]MCA3903224.1 DUF2057 domain-containing protein [Vibrio vulnificus]